MRRRHSGGVCAMRWPSSIRTGRCPCFARPRPGGEPSGLGRWGCRVGRCRRWNRVRVRRWCRLRRGRRWNGLGHVFFPLRLAGEIGSSQAAVPISTARHCSSDLRRLQGAERERAPRGSNASCSVASSELHASQFETTSAALGARGNGLGSSPHLPQRSLRTRR